MKLRNPPRYGAISMYRLLASVVAGEPVQLGDAELAGPHGRRDARLTRYAGPTPSVTLDRNNNPTEIHHGREDSPPDAQQPAAQPETHP